MPSSVNYHNYPDSSDSDFDSDAATSFVAPPVLSELHLAWRDDEGQWQARRKVSDLFFLFPGGRNHRGRKTDSTTAMPQLPSSVEQDWQQKGQEEEERHEQSLLHVAFLQWCKTQQQEYIGLDRRLNSRLDNCP